LNTGIFHVYQYLPKVLSFKSLGLRGSGKDWVFEKGPQEGKGTKKII